MLDNPQSEVRDAVLCSGKGRLLRTRQWALLDYGKTGELYDMKNDPQQYTNLFHDAAHAEQLAAMRKQLAAKLQAVSNNDLQ